MEFEPERGIRCTMCFDMRFERTALYAYENGFDTITSSLGISRWKNFAQINDCGERAAEKYEGITYWTHNWRKKEDLPECSKSASEKDSTCKNIVAVHTRLEIATTGVFRMVVSELKSAKNITATTTTKNHFDTFLIKCKMQRTRFSAFFVNKNEF